MSKNSGRYSDIIDLPHHQSIYRPHMTVYNRAAQFAPFAALVGYDEMVQDTADILLLDKRIILSEDAKCLLDVQLQGIREKIDLNPEIKIVYFDEKVNKLGGGYALHSGKVKKIEEYPAMLVFLDGKKVLIEDIIQIENEK
ncbi:hypothetical protein [Anaerotignum sp.]